MALKSGLTISTPLGAGHFGQVLLGQDPVHGPVAVKILKRADGQPELDWQNRRQELLKEGERLAKARHANVVEVYHILENDEDDSILIVMELCAGSLQPAYDAGPIPLLRVRDITTSISLGLEAIHARNMLHRDIKPGNILVDANNRVKIGDFGLVTDDLVLGYGSINGYSDHVAFEVYHGIGTSVRSDIWALGMTVYRLLHGARWYGSSPAPREIIAKGGFAKGLTWLPHIPAAWQRFIRKCMTDETASRFQTMQQVNAALASLPVDPNWDCTVANNEVSWSRVGGGRRHRAVWRRHGARTHEWSAWSEPLGDGRTRSRGGSDGVVNQATCLKGLAAALK